MKKIYILLFIALAITLAASAATPAPTPKPASIAPTPTPATPAPTPKPASPAPTPKPATPAPTVAPTPKAATPAPTAAPTPKPPTPTPTAAPAGKYGPGAPPRTSYDYIIIGAGETGSVVAKRLTDDSRNFKVLVIEAGFPSQAALGGIEYAAQRYSNTSSGYVPALPLTVFDIPSFYTTTYSNGQELYEPGTHIPVEADWGIPSDHFTSQGKIVGGSGCHNGMVWVRATPGNLAAWNVTGWNYTDLLPYFIKSENATLEPGASANPTLHGFSGPISIVPQEIVAKEANITVQSTINKGYPGYIDPNSREDGSGIPPYNIRRGVRDSTAVRYLLPNLGKSNLDVLTLAQVTKINWIQGSLIPQAQSVTWTDLETNTVYTATAAVEVIFAAGPLNTPKILMWSGYGPSDELARWSIPLVVNNTNVGHNIRNWFGANLNVASPKSVFANLNFLAASALQYAQFGTGWWATAQTGSMTWLSTNASLPYPDIWFNSHYVSSPTFDLLQHGFNIGPASPVYADGYISINSTNPLDPPYNHQPLLTHQEDVDTIVRAFGIVRQILATEPAASFFGPEVLPGANVTGPALEAYVRANVATVYHYTGSCKMGNPGDPKAVVDNNLKLLRVTHVRIVDTSIFAGPVRTNFPHATSIAIAEKASVLILGDAPSASQV